MPAREEDAPQEAPVQAGVEDEKRELPFQLQISYSDMEGAKALRVITQCKPVTRDRRKAERCTTQLQSYSSFCPGL